MQEIFIYGTLCLSISDLLSEQTRIEVHETNTTGTQNNDDLSNFWIGPGGEFASFFASHPGAFDQRLCPHPWEFANAFQKNAYVRGSAREEVAGEEEWAPLELTGAQI